MSLVLTAEAGGGVKLDPGTYPVVCMDVKEDRLDNSQFGNGDVIRFVLEVVDVLDENGEPVQLDAIANRKLTPKSKLWGWLEAFGLKVAVGAKVNIEDAVGREAFAIVIEKEGSQGGSFARIESIVPAPSRKPAGDPKDMPISEWWALVRSKGHDTSGARDKAVELFGKEPKDLSGEERAAVLAAL
jgi:hypothetical protein